MIPSTTYETFADSCRYLGQDTCAIVEMSRRKTVCTTDVVWALNRQGRTIYVSQCTYAI